MSDVKPRLGVVYITDLNGVQHLYEVRSEHEAWQKYLQSFPVPGACLYASRLIYNER